MITKKLSDISDEELDNIAREKQHKEILSVLKQLLLTHQESNDKDIKLAELLSKSNGSIDVFINKLKEIGSLKIPVPQVNLTNDNSEVIKLATLLKERMDILIDLQRESNELRKADVKMIPKKGQWGGIEEVTVKTILPTKSKYQA